MKCVRTKQLICDEVGHNAFYVLSIIFDDIKKVYFLQVEQGRIGGTKKQVFYIPVVNPEFTSYQKVCDLFDKKLNEKLNVGRDRTYRALFDDEILEFHENKIQLKSLILDN